MLESLKYGIVAVVDGQVRHFLGTIDVPSFQDYKNLKEDAVKANPGYLSIDVREATIDEVRIYKEAFSQACRDEIMLN